MSFTVPKFLIGDSGQNFFFSSFAGFGEENKNRLHKNLQHYAVFAHFDAFRSVSIHWLPFWVLAGNYSKMMFLAWWFRIHNIIYPEILYSFRPFVSYFFSHVVWHPTVKLWKMSLHINQNIAKFEFLTVSEAPKRYLRLQIILTILVCIFADFMQTILQFVYLCLW